MSNPDSTIENSLLAARKGFPTVKLDLADRLRDLGLAEGVEVILDAIQRRDRYNLPASKLEARALKRFWGLLVGALSADEYRAALYITEGE